jgi:hypothetical protein
MQFSTLDEFDDELKNLLKKYRSLNEDLEILKRFLEIYPKGREPGIVRISGLGVTTEIYKVKHFRCKALKNKGSRSGIRVIYAYLQSNNEIQFAEIYYKEKDDVDCDKARILRYYK